MLIFGASLPVVVLTLAALVLVLWGWAVNIRHVRAVGRLIAWLETHRAEAWQTLPWAARRLMPQSGIAALKRRGETGDPAFETMDAEARRLARRSLYLVLAGAACLALLIAGIAVFGWRAG
jgi:hypothetical protein